MKTLFGAGPELRVNPFENPTTPLTSAGLIDFFGGSPTDAGVSVSEENSLQFGAVFRCVSLLSGLVAASPIKCRRYADDQAVPNKPMDQPNSAGASPYERMETSMLHLLLWGNSYQHKVRNAAGKIVELRPIHPSRVTPSYLGPDGDDPAANKVFQILGKDGQMAPFTNYEILHIPGLSLDGLTGLSPIGCMRQAVAIGMAADKMAAKLYGNGALLSGILTTERPLDQKQADTLKRRWRDKMQGLSHAHDIAVLDNATKFQPVGMPPEEAQFLQSRRWQVVEIARWYGIPPWIAGDVEKSTSWGTGLEQQKLGLLDFTVRPWLTRIEQRFTWEVVEPTTQYAQFLIDTLLRADTLARYQAYALSIQWGWMTRNEARVKEGLKPIDGLDEPLQPAVPTALSVGGEVPVPGTGGGGPNPVTGEPDDDDPDQPTGAGTGTGA